MLEHLDIDMEKKIDPSLEIHTNINSKCTVFLNKKHKNRKLLKENGNLCDLRLG